jgi:hypothetical protein
MPETDDAVRQLARFQEGYAAKRDLLVYEEGHLIEAKNCADAWRCLNSFMFDARALKHYRLGNRHMVPRVTVQIKEWKKLIPLTTFGYKHFRINRLKRNYLNEESLAQCRAYMDKRKLDGPSTHGIIFGTGRKATPPCLVSGHFFYRPGILLASFTTRASEVTKTLGADLHFLEYVLDNAVPPAMRQCLGSVTLHLGMAYSLAQWFPLLDMIMPGFPINQEHRFHQMCMDSVRKMHDPNVESKWKPERRMQRRYRAMFKEGKYRKNLEGRIVDGPSYFPLKAQYMCKS